MGSPMFDPPSPQLVAGIPNSLLLAAVALLIMGIGSLWAFRMARGDPDPDSFWATTKARSRINVFVKAGLLMAFVAAVALAQLVANIRSGKADF